MLYKNISFLTRIDQYGGYDTYFSGENREASWGDAKMSLSTWQGSGGWAGKADNHLLIPNALLPF